MPNWDSNWEQQLKDVEEAKKTVQAPEVPAEPAPETPA